MVVDPMSVGLIKFRLCVALTLNRGKILSEASEGEEIIYSDIEPEVMKDTRGGIPVTVQRRFDVYSDVRKLPDLSSL